MDYQSVETIVISELEVCKSQILQKLSKLLVEEESDSNNDYSLISPPISALRPSLPDNDKYEKALYLYQGGSGHSQVAKKLGVSISQAKKYHRWLVINNYLIVEEQELSETEKKVVDLIFCQKKSLREVADRLNCSVTNVIYRRDSALAKGYKPDIE